MTSEAVTYHPWTIYMWAREEARRRGDRTTGTDHLVLGLLEDPSIEDLLGVSLQDARKGLDLLDREALVAIGIDQDLDVPPLRMHPVPKRPTFASVVKGGLKMTPAAKRVLEETCRPRRRGRQITPQQVLVGILDLESPDPAADLLGALGVDGADVKRQLESAATGG
jgi:ClpA/ClpB-like protein